MPTYTVTNSNFYISFKQQKKIAQGITKVHNIVTGANTYFAQVIFDKTKPSGDKKRVLDTSLAKKYKISCKTKLSDGIMKTIEWYLKNKRNSKNRFNYFKNNN